MIGMHLLELKQVLPKMEGDIDSSEKNLLKMKMASNMLRESLAGGISSVNSYFSRLP